jgi:hypothetical protein
MASASEDAISRTMFADSIVRDIDIIFND